MSINTTELKKFAQSARRQLLEQVAARMEQVLRTDSVEIREKAKVVDELKKQIGASSKEAVIDRVAYTWFNRFCALRFMDVNHYTRIGVVSPVEGHTQPEVLAEAKQGVIDESFKLDRARVFDLLNGQYPSSNPQQEAYRLLLVGACNAWHAQMPFLFPEIEDYTELLMPDDLLSENSVLQGVRETLTPAACQDVEVIGWLYQYYISERKDEVFAALKQNQKIEAGDIPAATQLFTPHWIVCYLVENSLGRLWMLNHPDSRLVERMDYYIRPEQEETDYLKIDSPEEIKLADPACGSGHMLTYAFDLLYAIYEEQGYDPLQIPSLILLHNLYGIEIDERAGDLAAFALVMKARAVDRRFFSRGVEPNICVLENISFSPSELDAYKKKVGNDLFTQDLWFLLGQFEQADNFGSLIRPQVKHPEQLLERLEELGAFDDLLLFSTNEKVVRALRQAEYLSPRYHVVVANPPYMGGKGMNDDLRKYAKDYYVDSRSDLFAMFIERGFDFVCPNGYSAMVTMQSWMFLSSYETLRLRLLNNYTIECMVHMGNMVMGIAFGTAATVWQKKLRPMYKGKFSFVDYSDLTGNNVPREFPIQNNRLTTSSARDFHRILGSPIAYWVSEKIREAFEKGDPIGEIAAPRKGNTTTNNNLYLRFWAEVSIKKVGLGINSPTELETKNKKWIPYNKGGGYRKWYGNNEYLVNWENNGKEIKAIPHSVVANEKFFFKPGLTWSTVTSGSFSIRQFGNGYIFDNGGCCVFGDKGTLIELLGLMNSKVFIKLFSEINPTLNFQSGDVAKVPFIKLGTSDFDHIKKITEITKDDWDYFETSWDFSESQLIKDGLKNETLSERYTDLRRHLSEIIFEAKHLEEVNNQVFIKSYGLEKELTPDVSLKEISLNCNLYYRYSGNSNEQELEERLRADTIKELISYAVGCMFGRYSLDKPGLILANAGETLEDYLGQVPEPSFAPDEDNVIPVLEGEWFADDIAERFKQFLKITFGTEHYEENLAFVEEAIGRDIRSYFVRDFYNEHVKMYKKRPIYWLFSSPNGSFNALVYMHRYRPDTVSVILNNYLRQYREKLNAHKSHQEAIARNPGASQGEKTKALKEVDWVNKVLSELKEYEDEILYPLATQQVAIELDDGVKVNYGKFGSALKAVKGLCS